MKTFKSLLLVKKKSHHHQQIPQFKPIFLGLKQELLGRRQPVSCARGETERSQGHHCPLGNKLQFSISEPRSLFHRREGKCKQSSCFQWDTVQVTNIITSFSLPAPKNPLAYTNFAIWQCSFQKRSGATMCKWCNHPLLKLQHFIKNSHHGLRFRTGFSWLSPSQCWQQRHSCKQQDGSVSIAGLRQMLRHWNNLGFPTYKSIYEDFSSFFTLMESINISQLLQQVNHSYGNMYWVLRTTNREANAFSINSRWLLGQCVHDMTPKQLAIHYQWGDKMHCNHSSRA